MEAHELARVEELVEAIYAPGSAPAAIKAAQNELLRVQKSDLGWALARELLSSPNQHAQFLGAVTVTININDDKKELPPTLKDDLLQCLHAAVAQNRGLVTKKLVTTMCVLYFRIYRHWQNCVSDVEAASGGSLETTLLFCQGLVEEFQRLETKLPALRGALENLTPLVGQLLEVQLDGGNIELQTQALQTFAPWCDTFFELMAPLLPSVIDLLRSDDYDLFDSSAGVLSDLYPAHSKAWPNLAQRRLYDTVTDRAEPFDWEIAVPLGRLAIELGKDDFEASPAIVDYLLKLTDSPETIEADELAVEVLEFWSSAVEEIVFSGMSHEFNPTLERVIAIYWGRIQLHNMDAASWDVFSGFRRDFADFLESAYQLLGVRLFEQFVTTLLSNLQNKEYEKFNWTEVEASLYCLDSLADIINNDERAFAAVREVFASSLWHDLSHCGDLKVRQTAVSVIGSYGSFFESSDGRSYLKPALTYLFQSLAVRSLQLRASRSVEALCSSCRGFLVEQAPTFLEVYKDLRNALVTVAHVRTVSAITYIIQALGANEKQAEAAQRLIKLIETSTHPSVDLLKCIAGMAKAFQVPNDVRYKELEAQACAFYSNDPLGLRLRIMQIINQFIDTEEVDVCETLCDIFKAGLRENVANPFVFGTDAVLNFVETKMAKGPADCRSSVTSLATYFASTLIVTGGLTQQTAMALLSLVTLDAQAESLRLMSTIISSTQQALTGHSQAAGLVQFALDSLDTSDRFVLRAASEFWTTFVSQDELGKALNQIGPSLVSVLVRQIGGEASRSDLSYTIEVLKKLLTKHTLLTGNLLRQAILVDPQSRAVRRMDEKTRKDFVEQLIHLRGGRLSKDLILKFWLVARGIPEY